MPKDFGVQEIYNHGFSIDTLFQVNSSGIKTHRDNFVIDINKDDLAKRIQYFANIEHSESDIRSNLKLKETSSWTIAKARRFFEFDTNKLRTIAYRPFDTRFIYYSPNVIDRGREKVMSHFLNGENVGLITGRQNKSPTIDSFFITNSIAELKCGERTIQSYVLPLYLYPETDLQQPSSETSQRTPQSQPHRAR